MLNNRNRFAVQGTRATAVLRIMRLSRVPIPRLVVEHRLLRQPLESDYRRELEIEHEFPVGRPGQVPGEPTVCFGNGMQFEPPSGDGEAVPLRVTIAILCAALCQVEANSTGPSWVWNWNRVEQNRGGGGLEVIEKMVARDGFAQHYALFSIPLTDIYLDPRLDLRAR